MDRPRGTVAARRLAPAVRGVAAAVHHHPPDLPAGEAAAVVAVALALGALQLHHSLAASQLRRPPAWAVSLLAVVALTYVPMWWYTWTGLSPSGWSSRRRPWCCGDGRRCWRPSRLGTGVVTAHTLIAVDRTSVAMAGVWAVYYTAVLAMGAAALYGSARLVRVIAELDAARTEVAELAVGRERLRVSRDLHDLLGQSLSAVSLKGDLAIRLLATDATGGAGRDREPDGGGPGALRDVRAVASDEHAVSLAAEVDAAAALLGAAGDRGAGRRRPARPAVPRRGGPGLGGARGRHQHAAPQRGDDLLDHRRTRGTGRVRLAIVNDGVPGHRSVGAAAWPAWPSGHASCRARSGPGRGAGQLPPGGGDPGGGRVIRVLIAEDMHLIRGALVALLSLEEDMEVVAELERGDAIVETAVLTRPDVAVLDIDLPGLDGLTAAESALRQAARVPHPRAHRAEPARSPAAGAQGARAGFIVKDAPADMLADGIRRVAAGERVIDPDLVAAALETGVSPLTPRETDVLRAAEDGIATDEIAARLSLSPATVRNYLSNAITKVGGRNRIDAIRIARNAGWL